MVLYTDFDTLLHSGIWWFVVSVAQQSIKIFVFPFRLNYDSFGVGLWLKESYTIWTLDKFWLF